MITHEEARDVLVREKMVWNESKFAESYISQQEKVTELLGLYRNFQYHVYSGNVAPRDRLNDKIQKLERELEETK